MPRCCGATLAPRARRVRCQRAIFGALAKRPVEPEVLDSYALPAITERGRAPRPRALCAGLDTRHTLEAAEQLPASTGPALIAWSREDRFFPPDHGERLAELLPQGAARVDRGLAHVLARGPARARRGAGGEPQRGRRGAMIR